MNVVLMECGSVVNRVIKSEVGGKMIVNGRAARWRDEKIKDSISIRHEVYKKVLNG